MLIEVPLRAPSSGSAPKPSVRQWLAFLFIAAALSVPSTMAAADPSDAKRIALIVANSDYKDASLQEQAPAEDADILADELNRDGFDVDLKKDLDRERFHAAIDAFIAHIVPGTTALLYFNGIGIQVAHQTFLIPVSDTIASEADVKKSAVSLDDTLAAMNRRGASVKIIVVDAARRNKIELRFRSYSAGLSSIETPEGTLAMFATAPNKVAPTSENVPSLFMSELVKELRAPDVGIEDALMHTRIGVSQASNGEQVPWVASSLIEPFYLAGVPTPSSGNAPSYAAPPPRPPAAPSTSRADTAKTPSPPSPPAAAPAPPPPNQSVASASTPKDAPPPAPTAPAAAPSNEGQPKFAMAPASPAPVAPAPASPTIASEPGKPGTSFHDCPSCPEMTTLAAGSFLMGDGSTMFDRPVHRVSIAKPFAIGVSEVTFADWSRCLDAGGCKVKPDSQGFGEDQHPVINISWFDAKEYIAWLSKTTGKTYRLPSEAEWEFAARGGTRTPFSWGASLGTHLANCSDCGGKDDGKAPLPVKSFSPNAYGLYDMAGNVAEWVEDCWNQSYNGAPANGSAWLTGDCGQRVLRGGSFDSAAIYTKPAARFRYDADVRYWANGFRVVRDLP